MKKVKSVSYEIRKALAMSARDVLLLKSDSEIKEIKKKETRIEEYGEINVELKELHFLREKAKIEQKNEEIAKVKQESINKIDKGYKKQIRKCKRELRRFCDDITDELIPAVRKELFFIICAIWV